MQTQEENSASLDQPTITELLEAWAEGEQEACDQVFEHAYGALKRLATVRFRPLLDDPVLQPTAIAHEAYLRLRTAEPGRWCSRGHFLAAAATAVRSVVIDHLRARARQRRGGDWQRVELHTDLLSGEEFRTEILDLSWALERLNGFSPRHAQVVELHFFYGLSVAETAAVLGSSTATVSRDWRLARAWLSRELT